jgi:hypothetical protein
MDHYHLPQPEGRWDDKLTPIQAQHSASKCMQCNKPPELECLWADGRGHAWFCKKCFNKWKGQEGGRDIVSVKEVKDGKVGKWADNKGPNIQKQVNADTYDSAWDYLHGLVKESGGVSFQVDGKWGFRFPDAGDADDFHNLITNTKPRGYGFQADLIKFRCGSRVKCPGEVIVTPAPLGAQAMSTAKIVAKLVEAGHEDLAEELLSQSWWDVDQKLDSVQQEIDRNIGAVNLGRTWNKELVKLRRAGVNSGEKIAKSSTPAEIEEVRKAVRKKMDWYKKVLTTDATSFGDIKGRMGEMPYRVASLYALHGLLTGLE